MDEQDHANVRAKLIDAIFNLARNPAIDDAGRLVADLSEFVRGIVREEIRAKHSAEVALSPELAEQVTRIMGELAEIRATARCTCPWSTEAPLSMDCPVHGVGKSTPHTHSTVIE